MLEGKCDICGQRADRTYGIQSQSPDYGTNREACGRCLAALVQAMHRRWLLDATP